MQMNTHAMINLTLLSKVSGFDAGFRREIIDMIGKRFARVKDQAYDLMAQQRFTACYLFLEQYLYDLQPYSELTFVDGLKTELKALRLANDNSEKQNIVVHFLNSVELGLVEARIRMEQEVNAM